MNIKDLLEKLKKICDARSDLNVSEAEYKNIIWMFIDHDLDDAIVVLEREVEKEEIHND